MGVLVIVLSFLAVRVIGSAYEKQLELKNSTLASEVINLSKLNTVYGNMLSAMTIPGGQS